MNIRYPIYEGVYRILTYKCPDVCAELLEKGHYHYFGPSKASLSIVYIFN